MRKFVLGLMIVACFSGAARAQSRPDDAPTGQNPSYAVEAITLGSKFKGDSATYKDFKCSRSEQFDGFMWCQASRKDSERQGAFEAIYSLLHAKDGTIIYANRSQTPAFLDVSKADRDIQGYARKFGAQPKIRKPPHRAGNSDAVLAIWGTIELEPLDSASVKLLSEGKSPKKGLLIDFLGNFARSAEAGLPIFRIASGSGVLWAGSFDQKGRGTFRVATVDASALQPGSAAAQIATAPQSIAPPSSAPQSSTSPSSGPPASAAPSSAPVPNAPPPNAPQPSPPPNEATLSAPELAARQPVDDRLPPPNQALQRQATPSQPPSQPPPSQPPPSQPPQSQAPQSQPLQNQPPKSQARLNDNAPPPPNQDQPPPATREPLTAANAEIVIARLQAELSAAIRAKNETDLALSDAEKAAEAARAEADIALRELEETRNDANAAKEQIEELIRTRGKPVSYVREMIVVGIFVVIGILLFLIRIISRMAAAAAEAEEEAIADVDAQVQESGSEGAVMPPVSASTEAASHVDPDDVVKHLAQTLGVQGSVPGSVPETVPLSPNGSTGTDGGHPAIEPQVQVGVHVATKAAGEEAAAPSTAPPETVLAEVAEVKKLDSTEASHEPVPLKSAT